MPPDDVLEHIADVGCLVEGCRDRADGVGADRVAALDQLHELVDDGPRLGDAVALAVECELVAAQRDRAAEPLAQGVEHAVADAGQLGRDLVGDGDDVLHRLSVGAAGYGALMAE